ncbi:MAG TPA: hypothetical protein VGQ44_12280 [Gemmatimonadaceae bacterium]|jgi:hypothetical protein|nr:hypothetical protein [Gemmatimonadaceae bacterium]
MNHRHLLPDEIDLLLDDEVGFGVTPLRAHIRECTQCRALVDEARVAVDALEAIPHFAPSHLFADRVMARVPVFVPWHVAARDAAERWLPQARRTRFIVAGLATSVASLVTIAILWVATQTDALVLVTGAAGNELRSMAMDAGQRAVAAIFGEQALRLVQGAGSLGIAAALTVLVLATAGSVAGFRALALVSSRRRA